MKRTLLFIAFVLTSLTMSAQDGLTVGDIQNSGCLNKTQEEKTPTIILTKEGSVLSVQLLNYESYTATTDFNVTSYISNDDPCTVTINVTPVIPEGAQVEPEWVCLFNVSFTIRDFEPNRFYLDCWWCKGLIELKDGEPMMLEKKVEDVTIDGISFSLLKALHKAMLVDWTTTEEDLHIPSKVTYENEDYTVTCISKDAFWNANQATQITIPKTVRSMNLFSDSAIYANPFRECKSLKWIVVEDGCPLFSSIDGVLFAENKTMLLGYPIASTRTTYTVPKGVTKIRSGAFHHNKYLRKLMIQEEVTDLGWHLFSDTQSLEELYIKGVIEPECMSDLFDGMNTKVAVYVQPSEVEKYKAVYKGPVSPLPWAQDDSDYLPFVDRGKRWIVTRATPGRDGIDEVEYSIPLDVEEVDGKDYYRMKTVNTNNTETETYLIREESQKVYYYDPDLKMEFLAFDYSLKEGDTYETYSYETHEMVTYTVWSVEDYTGGPQVKEYYYDENTGNMAVRYRYLRKWVVSSYIESVYCYEPKVWIEGVGSLERPLTNLYQGSFTLDCLAYVLYNGQYDLYLPFSFNATDNKVLWYGRNMPISAKDDNSEDEQHQLTYEMEGDRLHVYGEVFCNCGPNHYAYFIEEPTDDHSVRKLHFKIQDVEPLVWCEALHTTDFYVEGLPPAFDYIIVDNQGEEHPVINKAPLNVYRPFIQDDKVWAVKVITDGLPTEEWMEYYYFDGDAIVGGQVAKRMLCDRISSSQNTTGEYVGAWYEQDQKVYFAGNGKQQFELLYDFTLKSLDTMPNLGGSISVVYKWTGIYTGFKGTLYSFGQERWYEGVGSNSWPYVNHPWYLDSGRKGILLVCKAGDQIIYYNSEEEDPFSMGAKKHRFDFTHTIKTKPKARTREDDAETLYGEYNNLLLGINLNPLDDTYLVRITNESGKTVYEKTVNAGNIVALNIDISAYPEGHYTVTIENNGESFTGEFDTQTTGISDALRLNDKGEMIKNASIYNLQGQRLNTLQKGLNIVNGRKVIVK